MLREWSNGDHHSLDRLMQLVFDELHKQAALYLRRERSNHTLQPTALIHEAYIKLVDQKDVSWENRMHFFAISAQLMRRILVDHAKARNRKKRGGDAITISLEEDNVAVKNGEIVDFVVLDQALARLNEIDERQVQVVELRFFSGLTLEETAAALKVSRRTVASDWKMAKAWLHREMSS